jgi:N-acyl-D-amino-acid deacylase
MRRTCLVLALLTITPALHADSPADAVKAAVDKGLRRLEAGAANYTTNRQCFSCHHQALPVFALTSAKQRGFTVTPDAVKKQLEFTLAFLSPKKEKIAKGQDIGGGNTTAVYALATLDAAGHAADETSAALVEYLLGRQRADGAWLPTTTVRPPTEGSTFTNVAMALRVLRANTPTGDDEKDTELRVRIDRAREHGRDWLLKNKPATTEDKAAHLRGLAECEAEREMIDAARKTLLAEQKDDGSWAQTEDMAGDAYATGVVLVALRRAGLAADDAAYRKGVEYLLGTQKDDGSWFVQTRSRPVQTFFDNGDPGGKSQFISIAATSWAVQALLELYPAR